MISNGLPVEMPGLTLPVDEDTAVSVDGLTPDEQQDLEFCALDINMAAKNMAWSLIDMGKAASRARDILAKRRDGSFSRWIDAECTISSNMVYGSIKAYEKFGHLDFEIIAKLHVGAALLLAQGNVPEQARIAAIEMAESGETVTKAAAAGIIAENAPDEPAPAEAIDDECPIDEPNVIDVSTGTEYRCRSCGNNKADEDGVCIMCREPAVTTSDADIAEPDSVAGADPAPILARLDVLLRGLDELRDAINATDGQIRDGKNSTREFGLRIVRSELGKAKRHISTARTLVRGSAR